MKNIKTFVIALLLLCALSLSAFADNMDNFVREWNGKYCNGGQCVALAKQWIAENHWPAFPGIAYAKDYAGVRISGYQWISNSPNNMLQAGDIVVFGAWNGNPYGHMSIAYRPTNTTNLTSFDQNWPLGASCSVVTHTYYKYVVGWFHKT